MTDRFHALVTTLLIGGIGFVQGGWAQSEIESVHVTGTYAPQPSITASSSVMDAAEIRALNKRSIAGLLKTMPGLLVEQQGGPGGLTAVSIRGGESNFTLVLVDGVPVNDPTNFRGGSFDFGNLNPALVERIEVVRGAQSAIYGSDALAGVINIITRRPAKGHSQRFSAEGGEDGFSDLSFSAMGILGAVDYTLELATRDDGEPVEGSTRQSDSANLGLGWELAPAHYLTATYRKLDGKRTSYPEQSGGPEYAVSEALDSGDYQDQIIALGWRADFTPGWRSKLTGTRFQHDEDYESPGIVPYDEVPPNAASTDFTRDELRWVNSLRLSQIYRINVGADYRDESGKSVGYLEFGGFELPTDFKLDRSTAGVFLDLAAQPRDTVLLQASARVDDPQGFENETSLRLGVSYEAPAGLTLAANWGQAFKLPSFFALGHALVGNPQLQPETVDSWDLGVSWASSNTLRMGLTLFYNDYQNLIDFDPQSFTNVNRKQVETSGAEAMASWQPVASVSLRGQTTYTDIDVQDNESLLTGRPQWTAGLQAQWQIDSRWSSVLDYGYTGEQYAASLHTGLSVTEKLDDYHRLDWVVHWQPVLALALQLSVDNLLDETYHNAVGFPGPGRSVRVGLRYTHN